VARFLQNILSLIRFNFEGFSSLIYPLLVWPSIALGARADRFATDTPALRWPYKKRGVPPPQATLAG